MPPPGPPLPYSHLASRPSLSIGRWLSTLLASSPCGASLATVRRAGRARCASLRRYALLVSELSPSNTLCCLFHRGVHWPFGAILADGRRLELPRGGRCFHRPPALLLRCGVLARREGGVCCRLFPPPALRILPAGDRGPLRSPGRFLARSPVGVLIGLPASGLLPAAPRRQGSSGSVWRCRSRPPVLGWGPSLGLVGLAPAVPLRPGGPCLSWGPTWRHGWLVLRTCPRLPPPLTWG